MQVCMKCAQIYISIYIMQIHRNSNIYLYLNFLLQLGSSHVPRSIPSQTPVVVGTKLAGGDSSSLAEDRLFTSTPTHITMDPCKINQRFCHSHSSKKIAISNARGYIIDSTTTQNTTTATTRALDCERHQKPVGCGAPSPPFSPVSHPPLYSPSLRLARDTL